MGKPLSLDCVFDFPTDEPGPHPAYESQPLLFWIHPRLHTLYKVKNRSRLGINIIHAIEEVAEPVAEVEEEQVIAPLVDMEEEKMDALVIDIEKDMAALFRDDDFDDDASDGFDEEDVWEVNEEWLMAPTTPPLTLAVPPSSVSKVGGSSTTAA
ncbi:hypothetical protein Tco_1014975 [Tanacetum coccineum]